MAASDSSLCTTVCSIVITCILLIAQTAVGLKYLNDCPRQPFIPVYLAVMGGGMLYFCCKKACSWLIAAFFFFWFIAGNICTFYIYKPSFVQGSGDLYCDMTLYWFAFVTTIMIDAVLFLACCSWCCSEPSDVDVEVPI